MGRGLAARSRLRASEASNGPISAFGFSAVKAMTIGSPFVPASAISRSAVATRLSQSGAVAQLLSMTSASALPADGSGSRGLDTGSARAAMTSAAIRRRSRVSHHGLRCGVSSRLRTRARIFSGGKTSACGLGGVSFRSHQMTGSASRPHSTMGAPKLSGSQLMVRASRPGALHRHPSALPARGRGNWRDASVSFPPCGEGVSKCRRLEA